MSFCLAFTLSFSALPLSNFRAVDQRSTTAEQCPTGWTSLRASAKYYKMQFTNQSYGLGESFLGRHSSDIIEKHGALYTEGRWFDP